MKKLLAFVFILQNCFLNAQKTETISLDGSWKLCFGLYDRNSSLTPEDLKKQSMWLIDYTIGKESFRNHYLAGEVPFKLEDYQRWYKKLNIKRE